MNHIPRDQRRATERANDEARTVFHMLAEKVFQYIVTCDDPLGPQTQVVVERISDQWKLFCVRKAVVPEHYSAIKNHAADLLKQYEMKAFEPPAPPTEESK